MDKINIEAFELDKGIYYVELQTGLYEIDGVKTNIDYSSNKVIIDLDSSPEIYKITHLKKIKYYKDTVGNTLLPEDYNSRINELTKNSERYGDDYEFNDIDEEYEYKKFYKSYQPEFESIEVKTKVIYSIKYNVYNLPKYIEPMRKINGDLKSTIYIYNQAKHILDLTKTALLDIGYSQTDRESTKEGEFYLRSDSIRFGKIDKCEFLTIKISGLRPYEEKGIYKDTYEKVFALYNKNTDNIQNAVNTWNYSKKSLKDRSYNDVIEVLNNIQNYVTKIETKNKTSSFKTSAQKLLTSLIQEFKEEAKY